MGAVVQRTMPTSRELNLKLLASAVLEINMGPKILIY